MYFWLGPAGDLRELPPIEHTESVEATAAAPAGEFVSLSGAVTRDRYGRHRRTWTLEWQYLTVEQVDEIDALRSGDVGWPLWLLDPQRPNLAPRQVATTGGELGTTQGWTWDAGTVTFSRLPAAQRPRRVTRSGVLTWTLATGQAGTLSPARVERAHRVPVDPRGGDVSTAAVLRMLGTPGPGASLGLVTDLWDGAGARSTLGATPAGLPAGWLDVPSVARPAVGAAGHVTFAPAIVAAGPCTVQVCGVRYGHGSVPPAPSAGGGAVIVLPREMPETYPSQDEISPSLVLVEA